MAAGLTKEEFIKQHGYDPEPDAIAEAPPKKGPSYSLTQLPRDLAVGALTAPTDLYGMVDTAPAAAKAAWNWATGGEGGFSGKMQQEILKPEAKPEIQKHLEEQALKWQQTDPDLTQDEMNELVGQYQKTKKFEDFINSQQTHFASTAAEWKGGVRRFFGDTRAEEERSWANDLGEIGGGALLGGPSGLGTKFAGTALGKAVTSSALNNIATRGTLRVAEALTPLTMPYSTGNVLLNFGVGGAIDTAAKAAQGKASIATDATVDPKEQALAHEDPAGVGTAATLAIATGATAMMVSALRGRMKVDLTQTNLGNVVPLRGGPGAPPAGMPQQQAATSVVPQPPRGAQGIAAGPDIPSEPQPMLPTIATDTGVTARINNALNDEFSVTRRVLQAVAGDDVAKSMDQLFSDWTGARLIDRSVKEADRLVGNMLEFRKTLTDEARAKLDVWVHHAGLSGKRGQLDLEISEEISNLQGNINRTRNPQRQQQLQAALNERHAELQRLRNDFSEHRPWLQDVSAKEADDMRLAFETSTDPQIVAFRDSWKTASRTALDFEVKAGKMDANYANRLHAANPYYVPLRQDPLGGKTGWSRVWAGVKQKVGTIGKTDVEDAGAVNPTQQAPIYAMRDTVPKSAADPRVNSALDPLTSLHDYVRQMYIDAGHTYMRNNILGHLLYRGTTPSPLMQGNHAKVWSHPDVNNVWFSPAQIRSDPAVREAMDSSKYVPRWQGGRMQLVQLGDTDIAAALRQFSPTWSGFMKIVAETSRWAKANTTGVFQPLFAFKNMYMDAAMATLRRSNRAFGSLSTAAFKYMPEGAAKVANTIPDPTALVNLHWYMAKGLLNIGAFHMAPRLSRTLAQVPGINAFAAAIGQVNFQTMVRRMLDATANSHMVYLMDRGALHSSSFSPGDIGKIQAAVDDFKLGRAIVPDSLRANWQAYTDILNAVHSAPKLMFYSQNYAALMRKYSGNIPPQEIDKLVHETANIAGDMSRKPGWKGARMADATFPYMQQMRAGTFYMLKNLTQDAPNAAFVWARLFMLTGGVAQGHLMMLNWDEESKNHWKNMPTWDRYRLVAIPTLKTALAWARGDTVKFSPDKVWMLPLAPDMAPIVAGTVYMLQQMGMIPSDAIPAPSGMAGDVPKVLIDSLTPMMPPLAQAALGVAGAKLDPQGADVRGGNWLRTTGSAFRKGPAAEAATNLGEVTQSGALVMSALLGANGSYMQLSLDTGMHAMKYHPEPNVHGEITQKTNPDFMRGLGAALSTFTQQVVEPKNDVIPLWQKSEKYYKSTPAWEFAMEARHHIENISGMRDEMGKSGVAGRIGTAEAGGMPAPSLQDQTLISIAQEVYAFNRPQGDLGRLKTQYTELAKQQRGFEVQYNKPYAWRREQVNKTVKKMQDNMQQQQLAIMWLEGDIADTYGEVLKPLLQGRDLTVAVLDDVLREARGKAPSIQPVPRPNANAPISVPTRGR